MLHQSGWLVSVVEGPQGWFDYTLEFGSSKLTFLRPAAHTGDWRPHVV